MSKMLCLALAAAVSVGVPSIAMAREGCGAGYHRGPAGRCRPNVGQRVVVVRPVIGRWYPQRGYWDGRRYWQNRYRHHNGWRYR